MQSLDLSKKTTSTDKWRVLKSLWRLLDGELKPALSEGICLAVSGGPDSRALLEVVARWPGRHAGRITVACIDHGLRASSGQEAEYVVARARVLGFASQLVRLGVTAKTDESHLRLLRYEALWQLAGVWNCRALATAHHLDDNVEGQLLHWLGAGGAGHGGMEAAISTARGLVLRPFISVPSFRLAVALAALNCTDYFLDPSNHSGGARAKVRHSLLPILRKSKADIDERLYMVGQRSVRDRKIVDEVVRNHPLNSNGQSAWFDYTGLSVGLINHLVLRGLRLLLPALDLRMSYRVCEQLANCIDPGSGPSTVKVRKNAKFNFPGVCATVSGSMISLELAKP